MDQENMVPGLQGGQVGRRMAGKNVALKSVGLGEQRSALGEITNVTTRRVTAGKTSKQVLVPPDVAVYLGRRPGRWCTAVGRGLVVQLLPTATLSRRPSVSSQA